MNLTEAASQSFNAKARQAGWASLCASTLAFRRPESAAGLFGGIPVTGTIARTATNVRAGAHGPIAGMIHSAALLAFILIAAPLAGYIPLAALAGVLVLVAWNMIEKEAIAALLRSSDVLALLSTFTLTVFRDLTEGILRSEEHTSELQSR